MALGRCRFSAVEVHRWFKGGKRNSRVHTRRRIRHVRLRALIGAGISHVDRVPRGPAGSITFSHASLEKHSNALFRGRLIFFYTRSEAKRDWLRNRDTLPLVPPKSHCHQRASVSSSLPRGKGDPESETRRARACAHVRVDACTKEPRAM